MKEGRVRLKDCKSQRTAHPGDLPHEIVRGIAALLDAQQLLLPLRRHGGGLYLLRHNGGQGAALVRGDQRLGLFITPALHKALLHQLLDDGRAGGGSADPFPLHIFGHLPVKGVQMDMPGKGMVIGSCPHCGADVAERDKGWFCSSRECRFVLWKECPP